MNKKAQIANAFSSLPSIAILLGIAIVIFSVMAQVTEDVQKTGITGVSNTSGNVIEGVSFCNSTNEINCSYIQFLDYFLSFRKRNKREGLVLRTFTLATLESYIKN